MPGTIYITIDRLPCGLLCPVVSIWKEKPVRITLPGIEGSQWLNKDRKDTSISMDVGDCHEMYGTVPDNDEQLIRKGPHESDYYN